MVEAVVHALEPRHPHAHLHALLDLEHPCAREDLERAVRAVIADFPVMGSIYLPGWWRDRWLPWSGDPATLVQERELEDPAALDEATKALAQPRFRHLREPPWRICQLRHAGGARLVLSVDHMVADGAGILTLCNMLGAHMAGEAPRAPVGDVRNHLQMVRGLRLGDLPVLALELLREGLQPWSLLRVQRRSLAPPDPTAQAAPHWTTVHLDSQRAGRFHACCRQQGATINDGLVASMLRVSGATSQRGPVAAAYTIDGRRYLPQDLSLVSNFAGVSMVVLPRRALAEPLTTLQAVRDAIGGQKRRLPGLAYQLLPSISFGWMPHGLVRFFGRRAIETIIGYLDRSFGFTNLGAMDAYLEPWGDTLRRASVVGPFVHGMPLPLVIASGFRGSLTLHACGSGNLPAEGLRDFAGLVEAAVEEVAK